MRFLGSICKPFSSKFGSFSGTRGTSYSKNFRRRRQLCQTINPLSGALQVKMTQLRTPVTGNNSINGGNCVPQSPQKIK